MELRFIAEAPDASGLRWPYALARTGITFTFFNRPSSTVRVVANFLPRIGKTFSSLLLEVSEQLSSMA